MTAASATLAGRRMAEALMVDACTITRPGAGESTYDPATDTHTPPAASTIYTGKCRVRPADTVDQEARAGETVIGERGYVVSIPIAAATIRRGDTVQVTASALDTGLVDTKFRVLGVTKGSHVTARRLACEETS